MDKTGRLETPVVAWIVSADSTGTALVLGGDEDAEGLAPMEEGWTVFRPPDAETPEDRMALLDALRERPA